MPLFRVLADATSDVVAIQYNMAAPPQPFHIVIYNKIYV